MGDRSHIVADTHTMESWARGVDVALGYLAAPPAALRSLQAALEAAEPYTPPARRALSVLIEWLDRDGVARQRVIVAEGTTTATTDLPSGFGGIIRVSVGGALVGPGWVTPEEWGPIPARCEVWPWDGCPDCNRLHGDLHTHQCGALDRGEDK